MRRALSATVLAVLLQAGVAGGSNSVNTATSRNDPDVSAATTFNGPVQLKNAQTGGYAGCPPPCAEYSDPVFDNPGALTLQAHVCSTEGRGIADHCMSIPSAVTLRSDAGMLNAYFLTEKGLLGGMHWETDQADCPVDCSGCYWTPYTLTDGTTAWRTCGIVDPLDIVYLSGVQVNGEYMDATTTAEATHWVVYHHETSTATPSTGLIVGAVIGGLVMTTALVVLAYRWRSKQPGYLPLN